jgi:hypothetical protein
VIYYLDKLDEEKIDALPLKVIYLELGKWTVSLAKYNPVSKEYKDVKFVIVYASILGKLFTYFY